LDRHAFPTVQSPRGSFAGVALRTIDVAYFSQFYAQFDVGTNGAITLLSADGIILARSPDDDSYVGRDLGSSPLFRDSRLPAGAYQFTSRLDDVQRLGFYKRSNRYPIMILATKAQNDVLASWRRQVNIHVAFVLALVALIAMLGMYIVRQLFKRQRMATALVAKEADFRMLAEEASEGQNRSRAPSLFSASARVWACRYKSIQPTFCLGCGCRSPDGSPS
jgi:hypothetical protein